MSKQRKKTPVVQMPEPYRSILRRVSEQDRQWFAAHRKQNSYYRQCVPGEFYPDWTLEETLPADALTLVTQVEPGFRTRQPVKVALVYVPRRQAKSA